MRCRASQANAIASTQSPATPSASVTATLQSGNSARSARMSAALWAPPPQIKISGAAPRGSALIASAMLRAVSATRVACTSESLGGSAKPARCVSSQAVENCSGPVLFGAGCAKYASANIARNNSGTTRPLAANAPSRSIGVPSTRRARASSRVLPGPVSKPSTGAEGSAGSAVRLAMPPMFTTTRSFSFVRNTAS